MSSFCFAELRKRNLIYQKISAPVFAARGIERKFQPCFFRSLSDISFVIYSMQKINRDKKASRILWRPKNHFSIKTCPKTGIVKYPSSSALLSSGSQTRRLRECLFICFRTTAKFSQQHAVAGIWKPLSLIVPDVSTVNRASFNKAGAFIRQVLRTTSTPLST